MNFYITINSFVLTVLTYKVVMSALCLQEGVSISTIVIIPISPLSQIHYSAIITATSRLVRSPMGVGDRASYNKKKTRIMDQSFCSILNE